MREKRLDIATNSVYSTGPTAGQPTKIAPPTAFALDGIVPGEAFGAQWSNYVEYYLQRQIEISSQVPFRNWTELPGMGSIVAPATTRFAFNRYDGSSFMVRGGGAGNSWYRIQEMLQASGGTPAAYTVAPAVGTFVARDVAAIEHPTTPSWLVVGSNSGATTKTIWKIVPNGADTEVTSPVAGSVELIVKDKTTGFFYAFAADTNRSVLVHGPATSDTWSVLGQRGSGAPAPTSAGMFCAAANGLLLLAYTTTPGSTQVTVERIATGTFSRTVLTPFSSTAKTFDVIYSPQMSAFMLLTTANTYRFSDPSGGFDTFPNTAPYFANTSVPPGAGCLHETGPIYQDGNGLILSAWLGDAPYLLAFGVSGIPSTNHVIRFDGSCIWFVKDESATPRVFRSLRSN